jgi:hypothetical protein
MGEKIFINYRRETDSPTAMLVYNALVDAFGREGVFMDVDGDMTGKDFVDELSRNVAECDIFLAIVGKGWIDLKEPEGGRRLDNPNDWVRIEIESALEQGKNVIPVRVYGAEMPGLDKLPASLVPFARRDAARLTHESFKADVQRLIGAICRRRAEKEKPLWPADVKFLGIRLSIPYATAVILMVAVVAGGSWFFWTNQQHRADQAAGQGDAAEEYNLGNRYYLGESVTKDLAQAISWYRKAGNHGHAGAQFKLGELFHNGEGVEKDDPQAMSWWRKAGDQGHAGAQFNIGLLYDRGVGVKQNYAQAMDWYRKAANQGNGRAKDALERLSR